jgi:hypothetical protein
MADLSNQQRLELITNMIHEAKSFVATRGSSQILLWGWVIALANLSHFILEQVGYAMPYIVWLSVFPTAGYSIYLAQKMKGSGVSSHIDQLYGQVWIAVAVVIVFSLLMMGRLSFNHNPVILAAAGAGMYMTGRLLKYRPVLIGAFVLWAAALVEWQVAIEWHYLISSIAVFIGYLLPGYLLKKSERV